MVHSMVERATSNMLIGPDWAMNIEICDMLNQDPGQAKDVVRGIKKRIKSKNSKTQLLALTLLETIVKNCGDIVHMNVAEKDVPHEMVKIVKKKPDFHVKEKILTLIDTWQEAFGGPRARYPQYFAAYQELLRAGAVFPKRSESSAPVFTPPQTQPLSSYPPNLRSSLNNQGTAEASGEAEYPTLSLSEIQNARGIMDVLAEMLSAIDPANKEALRQEVIVDLVEQCRTYKLRVVHLVNSTTDEAMLGQGLALNDDLQKLLAKHEAIVSGTPISQEKPEAGSSRALVDVDAPLVDTGESSKPADRRSDGATVATPPGNGSIATSTEAGPKIDLLSGDLLSGDDLNAHMPAASQDALALVPVSAPQPSSPVASQHNSLALFDMFSASDKDNNPVVSNSQPAFSAEQALTGPEYQQNHSLQPPQSNPYANRMGLPEYQPPGNTQTLDAAWNAHVAQQQPHVPEYGAENGEALPPPPWESQPSESQQESAAMFEQHQLGGVPNGNYEHQVGVGGMYPQQMTGSGMMYPHAYHQGGAQMMGMPPQGATPQMPSMYPSSQVLVYGNQMPPHSYAYGYGYAQPPDAQYLHQTMSALSLRENGSTSTSNHSSMASYLPPMKQQPKGDDKLFGDLVNLAKSKPANTTPTI